ncbi:MAG TPA: histidine kinase [Paenibacillus sp.]
MPLRKSIFFKINAIIIILLVPVLLLYSFSNQASVSVVQSLMQKENGNQLELLRTQVDTLTENLSISSLMLTRDPTVLDVERFLLMGDAYGIMKVESTLLEKLNIQSTASNWSNDITVYFPSAQKVLSTMTKTPAYDESYLQQNVKSKWTYNPNRMQTQPAFVYYALEMYKEESGIAQSNVIVEVMLQQENLTKLLDQFKRNGKGDPFMMNAGQHVILNHSSDTGKIQQIQQHIQTLKLEDKGSITMKLDDENFLVDYVYAKPLDFYIVDYIPMQQILSPITDSRNLFYGCILLLLVMGFVASFLLYKNVQVPLISLIGVLRKFKDGDFSVRISQIFHNEFDYVVTRFNDMAEQTQYLIENVYEERSRSRLATLKQLQAQINPHFLYNCLYFIASSANLGRQNTVMAMAYNLGDYYRYTTRLENQMPTLEEEVQLVRNYLEIHKLRLQRVTYDIHMDEGIMSSHVPRLILQPIVENAIVHGIESKRGQGTITLTGRRIGSTISISVEDSGPGLTEEQIDRLREQMKETMSEEMGYGMWNVNQRLKYWFGESAGIEFTTSVTLTGLCVTLVWDENERIQS